MITYKKFINPSFSTSIHCRVDRLWKKSAEKAGDKIDYAAENVGDKIKSTTDKVGDKLDEAGDKIKNKTY